MKKDLSTMLLLMLAITFAACSNSKYSNLPQVPAEDMQTYDKSEYSISLPKSFSGNEKWMNLRDASGDAYINVAFSKHGPKPSELGKAGDNLALLMRNDGYANPEIEVDGLKVMVTGEKNGEVKVSYVVTTESSKCVSGAYTYKKDKAEQWMKYLPAILNSVVIK